MGLRQELSDHLLTRWPPRLQVLRGAWNVPCCGRQLQACLCSSAEHLICTLPRTVISNEVINAGGWRENCLPTSSIKRRYSGTSLIKIEA